MKPYFERANVAIYHADFRDIELCGQSVTIADPPYGETSLVWDQWVQDWPSLIGGNSLWCFGSMRMFFTHLAEFSAWRMSQDLVWEKHNGSGFHADRFKRIHECIVHWYRGQWGDVYKQTPTTPDATARTVRSKSRPPHTGYIEATPYVSYDGGPRLMRSIIYARSCHGYAEHPTQKPVEILAPLIEYSCPVGGLVWDPFMGSGSVLVAARLVGRSAVGADVDERYCEIAARRLSQEAMMLSDEDDVAARRLAGTTPPLGEIAVPRDEPKQLKLMEVGG